MPSISTPPRWRKSPRPAWFTGMRFFLYTLHLGLVVNTECYYRNYDADAVLNMSKAVVGAAMQWLCRPTERTRRRQTGSARRRYDRFFR